MLDKISGFYACFYCDGDVRVDAQGEHVNLVCQRDGCKAQVRIPAVTVKEPESVAAAARKTGA